MMNIKETSFGFEVVETQESIVRETRRDGVTVTRPASEIFPDYHGASVVFATAYQGNDCWDTDINCGMQRWHGTKSGRQIRSAMRKCGFSKDVIDSIIKSAKIKKGHYASRY